MVDTAYDKDGIYLGKVADVFGEPTRRAIYRHLRGSQVPRSATEVAGVFGVHRTVARAHLERLTDLGLVETGTRRRAGGGRPAKTYAITPERLEFMVPPRRYERLARLLLRTLGAAADTEAAREAAVKLGYSFGEETAVALAGEVSGLSPKTTPIDVIAWMDAAGYDATLGGNGDGTAVIEVRNCVYRELADEYPDVVCGLDKGMLCGMLGVCLGAHTQTHSLSAGDDLCRHEFKL